MNYQVTDPSKRLTLRLRKLKGNRREQWEETKMFEWNKEDIQEVLLKALDKVESTLQHTPEIHVSGQVEYIANAMVLETIGISSECSGPAAILIAQLMGDKWAHNVCIEGILNGRHTSALDIYLSSVVYKIEGQEEDLAPTWPKLGRGSRGNWRWYLDYISNKLTIYFNTENTLLARITVDTDFLAKYYETGVILVLEDPVLEVEILSPTQWEPPFIEEFNQKLTRVSILSNQSIRG